MIRRPQGRSTRDRTGVDFGAAICFVIGSVFFFYESLSTPADWLFLIGSILFAVKPSIDMIRSVHLRRLPRGDGTSPASSGGVAAAAR